MAWTTPATWTDGEIPDANKLNAQIKNNHTFLSTHTHSGASGDGSASLAPTTITYPNQGSDPAAPGSGKLITFEAGDLFKSRAGTSGAVKTYSTTDHTHTIQSQAVGGTLANTATSLSTTGATNSYVQVGSVTYTPATSASGVGLVGTVSGYTQNGVGEDWSTTATILLKSATNVLATSSGVSMTMDEVGRPSEYFQFVLCHALISPAQSSTVFSVWMKGTNASYSIYAYTYSTNIGLVDFDSG